jgi:hypothetical protein
MLAILGGSSSIGGTIAPWISTLGPGSGSQRGLETTVGILVCALGGMMVLAALLRIPGQRLVITILSLATGFWLAVSYAHYQARPTIIPASAGPPLTLGYGWYLCGLGVSLALLASVLPPLWHHVQLMRRG